MVTVLKICPFIVKSQVTQLIGDSSLFIITTSALLIMAVLQVASKYIKCLSTSENDDRPFNLTTKELPITQYPKPNSNCLEIQTLHFPIN